MFTFSKKIIGLLLHLAAVIVAWLSVVEVVPTEYAVGPIIVLLLIGIYLSSRASSFPTVVDPTSTVPPPPPEESPPPPTPECEEESQVFPLQMFPEAEPVDPTEIDFEENLSEEVPHRDILLREENQIESDAALFFIDDEVERENFPDDLEDLYLIGPERADSIRDWMYAHPHPNTHEF